MQNNEGKNINSNYSLKDENEDNLIEEIKSDTGNKKEKDLDEFTDNKIIKYKELIDALNYPGQRYSYDKEFLCNILLFSNHIQISFKLLLLKIILEYYIKRKDKNGILRICYKLQKMEKFYASLDIKMLLDLFCDVSKNLEEIIYARFYIYLARYIGNNNIKKINTDNKIKIESLLVENTNKFRDQKLQMNQLHQITYSQDKYIIIKNLMDSLLKREYKLNEIEDEYIYIINKSWLLKAYNYIKDYFKAKENNDTENFFKQIFMGVLAAYFPEADCINKNKNDEKNIKNKKKDKNNKEENNKYHKYPDLIDNYSLIDFKDCWENTINKDENCFLKKDLKEGKDYLLLNKLDWDELNTVFGSTNVILRKKNNLDLIQLKFLLFDRRINQKNDNTDLLKLKYIQINNKINVKQLKEKKDIMKKKIYMIKTL